MIHALINLLCIASLVYLGMVLATGYWDFFLNNKKRRID